MSNEDLAKVVVALLDKYELDEAFLLMIKLEQALKSEQQQKPCGV